MKRKLDLEKLTKVLRTDGSLVTVTNVLKKQNIYFQAVTQLPIDYIRAIKILQEKSPSCLELHHYPSFHLPDGSLRKTLAIDSESGER